MPPFDWMTDPAFQDEIRAQVRRSTGRYRMREYRTRIISWMAERIERNSGRYILEESRKEPTERRNSKNALQSVDRLMRYACELAERDNRDLVTLEDVEAAFQAHVCMFWPIC